MPVVQAGDDVIDFPDSMSSDEIQAALRKRYPSPSDALDFATKEPAQMVGDLTKTLEAGAEGADMGRARERLSKEMQQARIEGNAQGLESRLLGGIESGVGAVAQMEPLNLLKRTMEIPAQLSGSNYKIQPLVSPEQVRKGIDLLDPNVDEPGSFREGVKQAGSELVSGLTSPDQAAALLAAKVNPELVGRLFQTQVASQIPAATQQLSEAVKSGDNASIGHAAAGLAATLAIPASIEKGLRPKGRLAPEFATVEDPSEVARKASLPPENIVDLSTKEAPPSEQPAGANRTEAGEGGAVDAGVAAPATPQAITETTTKPTVTQTRVETPEQTPPIPQGPGARTYESRAESPESYEGTALKNAVGEVERASFGLPGATETQKRAMAISWIKAGDRITQNPLSGQALVDALEKDPGKGLDDVESAVLLRHKVAIENAINDAAERTNTATDPAERARAQSEFNTATARLGQLLDVAKARGSEWGREGRWRQAIAREDFSLSTMTKRFMAEKGGRRLTEAEQMEVTELHKRLAETEKRATEAESKQSTQAAEYAAEREINRLALQAAQENKGPAIHPKILDIAESIVQKMEARAVDATNRLREKMTRFSAGVDPTIILDLAEIGSAKIARGIVDFGKWSEAMLEHVKDDRIKPFLQQAWEKSQELFNSDTAKMAGKNADTVKRVIKKNADLGEQRAAITDRIKSKIDTHRLDEIHPLVQQLAKTFSAQGLRGWRAINDAVHGVLKQIIPDLDYRETMDAVSGHGKFRLPSPIEADAALRDAKAQTNQIRKIQEVIAKQPVKPTGYKRDIPSAIQRRLTQIYENAKRRFGVTITDPATQLRSALQARKTYYTNRMSDLQAEINARKRVVKNRALPPTDPELESLISKYKTVKDAHDAVFGQRELNDAQRAELEAKSLDRQIEEVQRQIKEGDIFPVAKKKFEAASNAARRANLEALKSEREYLRDSIQPPEKLTPEERQLSALKARLARDTADKVDRMARGDFSKKAKRPPPVLDAEAVRLRDENEKVKEEWQKRLIQERLANRTTSGKMADMLVQWSRIAKLASLRVYPKLLNAALLRSVFEPISRVAGQPLRLIAPDVYRAARGEAGMSIKSEAKYWATAITSWGKAWEKLKTGSTDIDRLLKERRVKPDMEMLNFVGNSHGMIKEPIRQASFERAKQLLAEKAIELGENPDDPLVATQIISAAAEHADRNIFAQPNMVTKYLVKIPIAAMKGSPLKTANALGRTMEFLMPIVNVGSNIAAHTMRLNPAIGLTEAALRLREVRKTGVITQADAESISRAFKLGTLGTVLAAYAWNNPDDFGGVYEEHRKKSDLKAGEVKILGVTVPAFMAHAPELMWLNTVASASRIYQKYVQQHPDQSTSPALDAAWFTVLAPVKNFPVVDAYVRNFSEGKSAARTAGALVRDATIPGVVTSSLNALDDKKRKPKGFLDEIKMGIPGLREDVPTK